MIWTQSLLGGDEEPKHVDTSAPQGKHARADAYNPAPAHEELLKRVREDAEADAIRHAEDMVDRDFPIVEEAQSIAIQRIASLGAAYAAARSRLDADADAIETKISAAEARLEEINADLAKRRESPSESSANTPPEDRRIGYWQVGGGLALGATLGVLVARLDLSPLGLAVVLAGGALLLVGLLSLRVGQPEEAGASPLQHSRQQQKRELDDLRASLKRNRALAGGLAEETLRLVEVETAFASQLVSTYENAVVSSLPVGSFAKGERAIRKQPEPSIPTPDWVKNLEIQE